MDMDSPGTITLTTPAKCAPFDSIYSIYLEKFENSSHVGRKTIIRGTCELFFGDIILLFAVSRTLEILRYFFVLCCVVFLFWNLFFF